MRIVSILTLALLPVRAADADRVRLQSSPVDARTILVAERSRGIHWTANAIRGFITANEHGAAVIWLTDRRGAREEFMLAAPEVRHSYIRDVTGAKDGTVVVLGQRRLDTGSPYVGHFLARVSADRSKVKVIAVPGMDAHLLTVTPDDRMWVLGLVAPPRGIERVCLRAYEPDGKLRLEETMTLDPKVFGLRNEEDARVLLPGTLRSSAGRIGWLSTRGFFFEFATNGRLMNYYEPPRKPAFDSWSATIALGDQGETYLGMNGDDMLAMWSLNRSTRKWDGIDLVDNPGLNRGALLLGFDRDILLTLDGGLERGGMLIRWRSW